MSSKQKVIVTCAITGAGNTLNKHPAVPVTPSQIASSALAAAKSGAAAVHIHVRDPASGSPSMRHDLYSEVVERIKAEDSELIINLTTGVGASATASELRSPEGLRGVIASAEKRCEHIQKLRPEMCSLDLGTMNFGEKVMLNSMDDLRQMARLIEAAKVTPELEVFDTGHIATARQLMAEGVLASPGVFQLCMGIPGGAPADAQVLRAMVNLLPPGTVWSAFGIGASEFSVLAHSVLLGGHARVGLEDNLYLEHGVLAPSNSSLVDKAVTIIRALGAEPATASEARKILKLDR